ncbi:MAG: DUF1501 domain-containing protein, partial [Pirellulaceae bacterium]|nr:DUF1501 domain-containing protein [Pirellulaceae bacterium]
MLNRRDLLNHWCVGFGGLALQGLLSRQALTAAAGETEAKPAFRHFPARAKRVIFLFMHGGPSHVDLFDPKPELTRRNGEAPPFQRTRV